MVFKCFPSIRLTGGAKDKRHDPGYSAVYPQCLCARGEACHPSRHGGQLPAQAACQQRPLTTAFGCAFNRSTQRIDEIAARVFRSRALFLGRSFNSLATSSRFSREYVERSSPFGKYCRSSPLVFSFEPPSQAYGERKKYTWTWVPSVNRLWQPSPFRGASEPEVCLPTEAKSRVRAIAQAMTSEAFVTGPVLIHDVATRAESRWFPKQFFACDSGRLSQSSKWRSENIVRFGAIMGAVSLPRQQ